VKRKSAPGKKAGAAKPNPKKRPRTNPEAGSSGVGNTSNETPSVPPFPTFDHPAIAQDYSHLPPPTIPGGVPIDVPYHPDIPVVHDEQPAPSATAAGDGGMQSAVPADGADQNTEITYVQHPSHSLPNMQPTPNVPSQPQAYPGQWAQVPQPPVQFPPHPQVPQQVIGAPDYAYMMRMQPTALNTALPPHASAINPVHPYPHIQIPPRPTESAQPPSTTTNSMRPPHFPPGAIPSPQSFISTPQAGLDYRQHFHTHTQQPPPLGHSHQRMPSFGQTAQPVPGYAPYGAYQVQASYSQSHSGYSMSPVGMNGPPPPLTSPITHEDISTPTSSRSAALSSSGPYIPLPPATLEPNYRPPPPSHTHGGGGAYPPVPAPAPPEAALQGYGYTTQQQTGYGGYRTSCISHSL
jgi:hypothetical protein